MLLSLSIVTAVYQLITSHIGFRKLRVKCLSFLIAVESSKIVDYCSLSSYCNTCIILLMKPQCSVQLYIYMYVSQDFRKSVWVTGCACDIVLP